MGVAPPSPAGVSDHPLHPYLSIQWSTSLMPLSSPVPVRPLAAAVNVHVGVPVDPYLFLSMTSTTAVQHGCRRSAQMAARRVVKNCHMPTSMSKVHLVRPYS